MGVDKDKSVSTAAAELRRQAEERMRARTAKVHPPRTEAETQRLVHELEVHQVELEMQNDELRQARDGAEKALEKYADLYDFAPVGYFTLDRDGIIGAANITGATLLGIERSRLIGRRFGLFVAAEARPAFTDFLGKVFTSPTKEACEVPLLSEGKRSLFLQVEAVAGASGHECRVAIIDISARRQLEEELEVLHAELEVRAAQLEAANIELEAFNYSISHDLRIPLTVINGYCQMVKELCGDKIDAQSRGCLQEIYEGTLRMKRLIDTLLDFSRLTHVEIRREKVDLSKVAQEVAMGLQATQPERQVTFRIAAGIVADGDPDLLPVVLDNLIGNAWKYAGSREGAVIEFGVTEVGGKPAFFVRDNGPGFDMALADKLFLPFQRLPGTNVEGHGIGLATVDRIVRRHGGRVWAESAPGQGATFFFTLEQTERRLP